MSVRLRPGVLIDDAQLPIVNAATAETLSSRMNVQPNVRNAHCAPRPKDMPLNPDISLLYTVGNMLIPDNPDIAKPRDLLEPDQNRSRPLLPGVVPAPASAMRSVAPRVRKTVPGGPPSARAGAVDPAMAGRPMPGEPADR